MKLVVSFFLRALVVSRKQKQKAELGTGSTIKTHIVISTDIDQYRRIYCNISAHIAQPLCDLFDTEYTGW